MYLLNNILSFVENGYAGNHLMAETDTGVAAGGIGRTIGDAVVAFNHANVMLPLVTAKQAVRGSTHVQFSDYTKVASSAAAEVADGVDQGTVTSITTTARTATISEHVIRADVSDLAWNDYKTNKRVSIMERITNDEEIKIAKKLPLSELELFANRVTQTNTVGTPNQRPANSTKGTGEFGGYSSYVEWAEKDPEGYQKANNSVRSGDIKIGY